MIGIKYFREVNRMDSKEQITEIDKEIQELKQLRKQVERELPGYIEVYNENEYTGDLKVVDY